ncbi:hypothetical protein DIPPA_00882 [Diplonema papillatum]|nr:hypothetical protein DIPPA_33002 [Diplonema papillatum]KAJ9437067.1 hypothetical protein DIPPA_15937 [Diplonema papillatum]KAJ9439999.1 hypothetical protein DIPPA_18837 [Diplonema papillatum]KAJ9442618.1 hypothetical protein DIPPA_00882 [Diplonema papillatum]
MKDCPWRKRLRMSAEDVEMLRMADLRALAPTDVVIVGPGLLRVSWWTTKEASLRMRESEVTYRVWRVRQSQVTSLPPMRPRTS